MVCMTTVLFLSVLLVSLALVGHLATPATPGHTGPVALVRRGLGAVLSLGSSSWSARQTIA